MTQNSIVYQKAFTFALLIIKLCKVLQTNNEYIISRQLLRSSTAIGANIAEALAADSKKDFGYKMSLASKEARESEYWIRILIKSQILNRSYFQEKALCNELIKLLTAIVKTTRKRKF